MLRWPVCAFPAARVRRSEASLRTLGSLLLALQVQSEGAPAFGSDLITLLADATPINQAVLVILVVFSVASWAIILQKFWSFRRTERDT